MTPVGMWGGWWLFCIPGLDGQGGRWKLTVRQESFLSALKKVTVAGVPRRRTLSVSDVKSDFVDEDV